MKHKFLILTLGMLAVASGIKAQPAVQIVQIARIEVDPALLNEYRTYLNEEIEISTRIEPGVISLTAVADDHDPARITIFETYADSVSYKMHLKSPHFLKYKAAVKNMVKHLELTRVSPISNLKTKTRQNLASDKILLGVFESGDVSKLDEIIAPDFVNHQPAGNLHGLDSIKAGVRMFHLKMGTVKLELKRQWADDEFVSDWVRFSSPGSPLSIEGMEVTRYINGKAAEHFWFPNGQAGQR